MAELYLNVIDGERLQDNANGSISYQVVCLVSGFISPAPAARLRDLYVNTTLQASDGRRIPKPGESHPYFPEIICLTRDFEFVDNDPDAIRIVCQYGVPTVDTTDPNVPTETPQIEGGATVQEVKTERDINGNTMVVSYAPFVEAPGTPIAIHQTGELTKQVPLVTLRFSWKQAASPGDKALYHVGTMNSDTFQNLPPKTWLCSGITFNSTDLGVSWNVQAEFIYNVETWDGVAAWIDPDTNRIPPDVQFYTGTLNPATQVGGLKRFTIYRSTQFADIFT